MNLVGGLGNQLFQIFHTIAYAWRHKGVFQFPNVETLQPNAQCTKRITYWDSFLKALRPYTDTFYRGDGYRVLQEPHFHYSFSTAHQRLEGLPPQTKESYLFNGYFQSYKYFADYDRDIQNVLGIPQWFEELRSEYPMFIEGDTPDSPLVVNMHIRMGDYAKLQAYHPLMPLEYYENALRRCIQDIMDDDNLALRERCRQSGLMVVYMCEASDSSTVKEIIMELGKRLGGSCGVPLQFLKMDDSIPDWKQLLLSSAGSSYHIIANSTFSWWGAWLNPRKTKRVYYPHLWFGNQLQHQDTSDMFPSEWTRIYF